MIENEKDEKEIPAGDAVGLLPDGAINVVPPEELEKRLDEVRKMRAEEGWGDKDTGAGA